MRRAALPKFRFIDLCAGIGGFRWALEQAGGRCVLSLERDRAAQKTYRLLHGDWPVWGDEAAGRWAFEADRCVDSKSLPADGAGDITRHRGRYADHVPQHDIMAAGFPCQPFSLAGVSKKNALGRPHGFEDEDQGQLFFRLMDIVEARKPSVLFLENVKNLRSHDGGQTWAFILERLRRDHFVASAVIDARHWVPQHRERTIIIAARRDCGVRQTDVETVQGRLDGLARGAGVSRLYSCVGDILETVPDERYIVGPGTWETLRRHKAHHAAAGNGFGYGLVRAQDLVSTAFSSRTLSARYHKDGAEILVERRGASGGPQRPRRLTPFECAGLMGLPKTLRDRYRPDASAKHSISSRVSDVHLYRQFGNSVVFPLIGDVAQVVVELLHLRKDQRTSVRTRAMKSETDRTLAVPGL